MKKMRIKKVSAVLLTAVVLFSGMPVNAAVMRTTEIDSIDSVENSAVQETVPIEMNMDDLENVGVSEDYRYTELKDGTIEIAEYTGSDTIVLFGFPVFGKTGKTDCRIG